LDEDSGDELRNEQSAEENEGDADGSDDPGHADGPEDPSKNEISEEEPGHREDSGRPEAGLTSESEEEPEHRETAAKPETKSKAQQLFESEEKWKKVAMPTRLPSMVVTGSKARQGKLVWNGGEWVPMTLEMFKGAKWTKAVDKRSERFYWSCKERSMTVWEEPVKVLLHEALHLISRKEYNSSKDILAHVLKKTKPNSETHERAKMAWHEVDKHAGVKRTHIPSKTPYDHTATTYSDVHDGKEWQAQQLDWCLNHKWEKGEAHGKPYWSTKEVGDGLVTWYAPHWFIGDEGIRHYEASDYAKAKELFDIAKGKCEPGEKLPGRIRTCVRANNYFMGLANEELDAASRTSSAADSTRSLMEDEWPFPKPKRMDDVWDGAEWGPMTHDVAMADGWEMGKDPVVKEKYYSNKKISVVSWTNPREFIYDEGKARWKRRKYEEARTYFQRVAELTRKFKSGTYKATPLYLKTIEERLLKKEDEHRAERRRKQAIAAGLNPDEEQDEAAKAAARKLRRSSMASAASQLSALHPEVLPRWVKETDYWDGHQWNRMNRAVALTGEWIARVHPQDKKLYWTNNETKFFTWRKPPPEKWFTYEEGKLLFKLRRYKECKRKFMSYDDPGYHYTARYIGIAEMHIQDARRRKEAAVVYEEAKELYTRGHHEQAQHAFEVVDVLLKGQKYRHTAKYLEVTNQHVEVHQKKEEVRKIVASRKTSNYFSRGSHHSAAAADHRERSTAMISHAPKVGPVEEEEHSSLLPPPPQLFGLLSAPSDEETGGETDDDDDEGEGVEWEWEYEDEDQVEEPPDSMPLMPSGGFSWPWETASTEPGSKRSSMASTARA